MCGDSGSGAVHAELERGMARQQAAAEGQAKMLAAAEKRTRETRRMESAD